MPPIIVGSSIQRDLYKLKSRSNALKQLTTMLRAYFEIFRNSSAHIFL